MTETVALCIEPTPYIIQTGDPGRYVYIRPETLNIVNGQFISAECAQRRTGPFDVWNDGFERYHFGEWMIQILPNGEVRKADFGFKGF